MRTALTTLSLLILVSGIINAWDVLLKDDFRRPRRYEILGPPCVEAKDGKCLFRSANQDTILFTPLDDLGETAARSSLTVEKRLGGTYASAGVLIYADTDNNWKLMLVESPNGKRYMELIERYCGVHQAQNESPVSGTRLSSKTEGELSAWEYGKTYELVLMLDSDAICGEVRDSATGQFWRRTFYFSSGKAVRQGRPALASAGFQCAFGALTVEGVLPPILPGFTVATGKAGSVVILRDGGVGEPGDQAGKGAQATIADRLRPVFEKAGFGVTMLSWDELGRGRVPTEKVDLLVVADARCLPVTAKPSVISFLRSRGKVLFIGAPAFGVLVAKCPKGWVTREGYNNAFAGALKTTPISFADGPWQRSAMKPAQEAKIEPDAAEGNECWMISMDLDGWDSFGRKVKMPFPEGHSITAFWAKGDDKTPQLSIEWIEEDGSRWIGAVPLTTSWKQYVLRPGDFPNWPDAKAKRGGAGDRLNPQKVATIKLGLSGSHTPKCKPGPHTFYVRDLASAPDPGGSEPDFRLPDIEALSASYKLYPLWETASLASAPDQGILPADWKMNWSRKGYASVPREGGRGFDRGAAWRWIPIVEAMDSQGRRRGALISLMLGNTISTDALWANVGLAEPADVFDPPMLDAVLSVAKAMVRGCLLVESGSRFFSYRDNENIDLGAETANLGRRARSLSLHVEVRDLQGKSVFSRMPRSMWGPANVVGSHGTGDRPGWRAAAIP